MGKLKDAAINKTPSECTSAACKKAEGMDLIAMVWLTTTINIRESQNITEYFKII